MIVPRPVRRLYTWTAAIPSGPMPCTHVAIPFSASGARKGLGQNSSADAPEAAPTCVTCPVRESQAQTVKSSRPVREWYSDQTSQRPSKAPSAWSAAGSGNALMCLTALVLASISTTPEKPGEWIAAKKERRSCASAKGTSGVVSERPTTCRDSARSQVLLDRAWHQPPCPRPVRDVSPEAQPGTHVRAVAATRARRRVRGRLPDVAAPRDDRHDRAARHGRVGRHAAGPRDRARAVHRVLVHRRPAGVLIPADLEPMEDLPVRRVPHEVGSSRSLPGVADQR